ncbi:hypothetical protein JCM8097_002806 [Rhodosporidiobolus ruineniae]
MASSVPSTTLTSPPLHPVPGPPATTTPPEPPSSSAAAGDLAGGKKGGLAPDGPSFPSTFSPGRAQHSRRPSRAERYEALVNSARDVLRRGSVGLEEIGLGFEGSDHGHGGGGKGKEREKADLVGEREWREAVRNLLKVVDGMSQQLSTHDEVSSQLKIAQSNLTLVESHAEFLEETLRRRESRSGSQSMSRHLSNGNGVAPPLPESADAPGSGGLFGLGFSQDDTTAAANGNGNGGGGKSFFRLPSKRKPTPSTASIASTSTTNSMPPPNPPFAHTLRSVSSSPRLGDYSPTAFSPTAGQPRFSTSTAASSVLDDPSPSPSSGAPGELFALQAQVSSLETECTALRSNNQSLRRNNDTLVGKCAELEKTKEDLMSDLESLSVELFSEANTLVAEERRARAKAEEEVERLRAEIDSLNSQLAILRQLISSRQSSAPPSFADPTSPDLPALPSSEPSTPPPGISSTLSAAHSFSASPARMPSPSHDPAGIERPVSTLSVASTSSTGTASGRKWFSFGRSSSATTTPEPVPSFTATAPTPQKPSAQRAASHPAPSGSTAHQGHQHADSLRPPQMARGDSGSSYLSDASAASFFSFRSAGGPPSAGGASPDVGSARSSMEEERGASVGRVGGGAGSALGMALNAGGKGKEKARELDLGIYIPGPGGGPLPGGLDAAGMAKTDSEGGRTVGLQTPVAAELPRGGPGGERIPLASPARVDGPGEGGEELAEYLSSPPLPPLPPATPHIPSSSAPNTPLPTSPTSPATFAPYAASTTPTLPPGPATARPSRPAAAPRPLAIHTSLTPPLLHAPNGQFSPSATEVGGPRDAEMAAARKSPKSPNALRWNQAAETLAGAERGAERRAPRSRSGSRSRTESGGREWERENLPPSPALPDGFKENAAPSGQTQPTRQHNPRPLPQEKEQQPLRPPVPPARAPSPVPPPRPSASPALRVDTSVPPALVGGVKSLALAASAAGPRSARPASPALAAPRPGLARAASSNAAPTRSTAIPLAPPSSSSSSAVPFPLSNAATSPPSRSRQLPPTVPSAHPHPPARPDLLRAYSHNPPTLPPTAPLRPRSPVPPGAGLTPSTSASSIGSSSTASGAGSSHSHAHRTGGAGGAGSKQDARPLSPDGTKAVEDLESLMQSILAMDEGVFGKEDGAAAGRQQPEAGVAR